MRRCGEVASRQLALDLIIAEVAPAPDWGVTLICTILGRKAATPIINKDRISYWAFCIFYFGVDTRRYTSWGGPTNKEPYKNILKTVTASVEVPVTLKIRTGWNQENRNGVEVAKIAEECGVQLLTIHGRTRECRFRGEAEYDMIAEIKQNVSIPIVANGDIDSPVKAKRVLEYTKADGLMIGRAAMGRPSIFEEINH